VRGTAAVTNEVAGAGVGVVPNNEVRQAIVINVAETTVIRTE